MTNTQMETMQGTYNRLMREDVLSRTQVNWTVEMSESLDRQVQEILKVSPPMTPYIAGLAVAMQTFYHK